MAVNILLYTKDKYLGENINFILCENPRLFKHAYYNEQEKALEYISNNNIQCILADRDFLDNNVFDDILTIYLDDETSIEGKVSVDVYQKRKNILEDLQKVCNYYELMNMKKSKISKNIISFYSTQGGSGKTTLAYCCAVCSAQKYKTAYLNLELSANLSDFYNCQWDILPEDYLFAIKEETNQKDIIYRALVRNSDNVYVLPSPTSIVDVKEINANNVKFLIDTLLENCQIERLIVDLSCAYDDVNCKVMEESDKVVLVYSDTLVGKRKKDKFLKDPSYPHLALSGKEFIVNNMSKNNQVDGECNLSIPIINDFEQNKLISEALSVSSYLAKCCENIIRL